MKKIFDDKVILVTGGTGTFGNAFAKIILNEYFPHSIRIYSRGEKLQYDMEKKFQDDRLRFFIGDVRDKNRLERAMDGVDYVVHAAALKHVPSCEYNPIEAIKTNIGGAINVIDCALDNNVNKVMAISTDKAVHPINLYGATKMTAEKLFTQANAYSGEVKTRFGCVRYGNVIGSRGSVIPLFKEQKETGTLTITDKRMTRYWLDIDIGVQFVINCLNLLKGGEIYIPKIPSMRIVDLAAVIAPCSTKKIIGIRPGEKLHEFLITIEEARHSREFDDFFVIEPEYPFWDDLNFKNGKPCEDGFFYSSSTNDKWLSENDLTKLLEYC